MKISLITFADNPEDIHSVEEQLLPFGEAIANYWQPIKTWSQIVTLISQNGINLIAITTALLIIILSYQAIKNRDKKRSNMEAYNKLALKEEKLILQAAHQAAKEDKPTSIAIASSYRKLTGKPIELNMLLQKLDQARQAGLIEKEIANREDEPILTWKTQISPSESSILRKIVSSIRNKPPFK